MDTTFCGLCAKFKALPLRMEKFDYPWGGSDYFYIEEGICSHSNIKVNAQQEMYCKQFCLKEEYAKRRNEKVDQLINQPIHFGKN